MQVVASGRLDARPGGVSVTGPQAVESEEMEEAPELCLQNKRGFFLRCYP